MKQHQSHVHHTTTSRWLIVSYWQTNSLHVSLVNGIILWPYSLNSVFSTRNPIYKSAFYVAELLHARVLMSEGWNSFREIFVAVIFRVQHWYNFLGSLVLVLLLRWHRGDIRNTSKD